MLKFDPTTLADWKSRNIQTISIDFIASGCEGTSIRVNEGLIPIGYTLIENRDPKISVYVTPEHQTTLMDAYITHIGNKWIMTSNQVLTRCGCGKSFGIKTGDSKIDKIRLLRSKLASSKGTHH